MNEQNLKFTWKKLFLWPSLLGMWIYAEIEIIYNKNQP